MTTTAKRATVRTLLELATPWVYRRQGRYTLRIRPLGPKATCTLSLKTIHRQTAVTIANHLLTTLRSFHLDNPDATWEDLIGRLKEIAEGILATGSVWDRFDPATGSPAFGGTGMVYSEIREDLAEIAATMPLSVDQAKAVMLGTKIMNAAERRVEGDLEGIVGIIDEMKQATDVPESLSVIASERAPQGSLNTVTFQHLADLYMEERKDDLEGSTKKNLAASIRTISGLLGDLDMATHTRADMQALRENLKEGRQASTVNKILIHLATIAKWAEANAHISKAFVDKLQIRKGAESQRKEFSPDQVAKLMEHANKLPATDWKRWGLSLGVITGPRISEIYQITSKDIAEVDGQLVMDINTNDGKSTKNKFSIRKVPLVAAYGLDLEALKGFAETANGKLFKMSQSGFEQMLNLLIRDVLGTETKTGLSFHSLRHHLSGSLKAAAVSVEVSDAITGHSSRSITYDRYGAGRGVDVGLMTEALLKAFGLIAK
ncbi:tyrosine-type recombinase/integrase [Pseudomonas japonica]|uniref:Site-specific recombinase XerD n=1 Tax=Pseudomonas japonica TaxID=256466 RepID=A0A239LQ99_9PSED|nr:tyrosine-type recombinase/integrase [Pseudomonas japonica]SNT32726.1 Site-specific recombinase XerD [Pseudomonas japonica]